MIERGRKRQRSSSRLQERSSKVELPEGSMEVEVDGTDSPTKRRRSVSRTREASVMKVRPRSSTRGPKSQLTADQQKQVLRKEKALEIHVRSFAKSGESDRRHFPKLVKHMNSGKRSLGTSTIGR